LKPAGEVTVQSQLFIDMCGSNGFSSAPMYRSIFCPATVIMVAEDIQKGNRLFDFRFLDFGLGDRISTSEHESRVSQSKTHNLRNSEFAFPNPNLIQNPNSPYL
jgi:hypothetical protein